MFEIVIFFLILFVVVLVFSIALFYENNENKIKLV